MTIHTPAGLTITPQAQNRLEECERFLDGIREHTLRRSLRLSLERGLERIAQLGRDDEAQLHTDFAPLSFCFFAGGYHGGLIFHGPDDNYGAGGAPTFSVTLTKTHGWAIHT